MLVVINVHAINPNYIFFNGTESKNDSKGQRKGWRSLFRVLHCLGAVNMASLIL